jgi:hypothetical protein
MLAQTAPAQALDWLHLVLGTAVLLTPLWTWLWNKVKGKPTLVAVVHGVEEFAKANPELADALKKTIQVAAEKRGVQGDLDKVVQAATKVTST